MNRTNATANGTDPCGVQDATFGASYSVFFFTIIAILLAMKISNMVLRRFGQPRIISDLIVGLFLGNVYHLRVSLKGPVINVMRLVTYLCFPSYMFVLGLEMEPRALLAPKGPEGAIAYAGVVSSLLVAFACYPLIANERFQINDDNSPATVTAIIIALATTTSPVVIRLTTDLKIGKSEIGRLAVSAGLASDMLATLIMCAASALAGGQIERTLGDVFVLLSVIGVEMLLVAKVAAPVFGWLNDRNPEGKHIKGADVVVAVVMAVVIIASSMLFSFDLRMNAFLVGLVLPRDGRMSNFLISNINFLLTTIFLPFCLVIVGREAELKYWIQDGSSALSWAKLGILGAIGTVGKVSGTLIAAKRHGLQWVEALVLGLLLNVKGYFHLFCAYAALRVKIIGPNTFLIVVFVVIGTIVYIPVVVEAMVRWARRRAVERRLGLQWHNPGTELRLVVGLHGPQSVPMAIEVMEATRGRPEDGGLLVYAVDMIELNDRAAAALVHGQGVEAVTVAEESVVEMREQIGDALDSYLKEGGGEGVKVRRLLAISAFTDMHVDICNSAQDVGAALIVLPFHKTRRLDGGMGGGHKGFRLVNQKVLRDAPCSVGIMVDRGLRRFTSASEAVQNVAAVFIGGADDREALAYAARISNHPGVRLTVIRFIHDGGARAARPVVPGRRVPSVDARQDAEMRVDDAYFAEFYERHMAGGKRAVGYMEKHVTEGAETVALLRSLEGQYQLFVVGRGRGRNSALTAGMEEWAACQEIGPIGDILASSEFSSSASVLVIQQHDTEKDQDDSIDDADLDSSIHV